MYGVLFICTTELEVHNAQIYVPGISDSHVNLIMGIYIL